MWLQEQEQALRTDQVLFETRERKEKENKRQQTEIARGATPWSQRPERAHTYTCVYIYIYLGGMKELLKRRINRRPPDLACWCNLSVHALQTSLISESKHLNYWPAPS